MSQSPSDDLIVAAVRSLNPVRDAKGEPILDERGDVVVREECRNGERPCPRVTCRQNLIVDQLKATGKPAPFTCALDVVDAHPEGLPRIAVAVLMAKPPGATRDIEDRALAKFAPAAPAEVREIKRRNRAKQKPRVSMGVKLTPPVALRVLDEARRAGKKPAVYLRDCIEELFAGRPRRR